MKITAIDCHVLLVPDLDTAATSSAQDDIVVFVHTDEGITGVGETDVNPWVAKAAIEAPSTHTMGLGLRDMLLGEDPLDTERLWEKLYTGSCMNGRRGAVICALGALDMALWDLKGKAAGKPCWQLTGRRPRSEGVVPYASLQPTGRSFAEYRDSLVEWALRAQAFGFTAAKLEVTLSGPYRHSGLDEPDEKVTEVVAACRQAVGPDFVLLVDVQYTWSDADRALRTLRDWEDLDVYLIETPLQIDDLEGYARLHREAPMPVAAGEWQTTRFEFRELMDVGLIDIVQPDVGRVGGLTEALRVCDMAAERGRRIIPHSWKTAISIMASAHLAAVTPHCPYFEFLPDALCDSLLRKELAHGELEIRGGRIALPSRPGLGVEVDMEALRRFEVG
jgi:L-alanine-DL-glutamate epimerase-like enolase superfamily enzyme